MKLNLYAVKDVVAQEAPIILTCPNDKMLVRQIKSGMLSQQPNFLNTHIEDKQVFIIGEYDNVTCVIKSNAPDMIFPLADIYDELVKEIRARNKKLEGVQAPVDTGGIIKDE